MTEAFQKEMEHIPTKSYYEWMVKILEQEIDKTKEYRVLEVGCAWGLSTKAFLLRPEVVKLYSVDLMQDVPRARAEVADIKAENRWKPMFNCDSLVQLPQLTGAYSEAFDIVFIDGNHSQNYASKDMQNGWKLLKKGGFMFTDDLFHKNNFIGDTHPDAYGVARAFWGMMQHLQLPAEMYPSWTAFGLLRKPL